MTLTLGPAAVMVLPPANNIEIDISSMESSSEVIIRSSSNDTDDTDM